MLAEAVVGTRMVINFKEHCFHRFSMEPIMMVGATESIRFAAASRNTTRLSIKGDEEMQRMKDRESTEIIAYEELSSTCEVPRI
jgi:hypothetical protein